MVEFKSSKPHKNMSLNSEFKKVCQWTDLTVAQILEICECEKEDFADDCAEDIIMCLNDNGFDTYDLDPLVWG